MPETRDTPGALSFVPSWLRVYFTLPKTVLWFTAGQFLINLINSSYFLLLNLYLKHLGMADGPIAALNSYRFLAVFALALPAGLWLRGRPLRKPLLIASILFPLTALASLEAVRMDWKGVAPACFFLMGLSSLILNVANIPMMMRIAPPERSSEALSISFASFAAASICSGLLASGLQHLGEVTLGGLRVVFDEHATLLALTLAGMGAPFFYRLLPDPVPADRPERWLHIAREDRPLLVRAFLPCLFIATGAGLSIQFLNLFFSNVHGLSSADYSAYGSISFVLVLIAGLSVPALRRRLGWRGSILGVQASAAFVLALMGLTELWKEAAWALPLALGCFLIRQPLMNMAGPSISELMMTYVGERNRELISAISGAVWSGTWWLAACLFKVLRDHQQPYVVIFLSTFALYLIGTSLYLGVIREVERRHAEKSGAASAGGEIV